MQPFDPKSEEKQAQEDEISYEAPAIIYEGIISTRAGSTPADVPGDDEASGVDLFGD